ncbi:hypothetical protein BMS3Abin03_00238 [bacterium BMS3Abin03]|nr:hypothetical protein BMS3Abin03_00238 [bacterium BMS3Abin03]
MKKNLLISVLLFSSIQFAQTDSTVILSEIMFYPASGPNEFIELYNFSETESIDIDSFKIKYSTANPDIITDAGEGTILPPQSFAIILEGDYPLGSGIYDDLIPPGALIVKISDNSFGSSGMANTSDRPVWLLSPADDTLEAYFYSANNSQSFSDEKIEMIKDSSQTNWANSLISNGTPGFQNSVTPLQFDLSVASLYFLPQPVFEGENETIFTTIKNIGSQTAGSYTIEIYNDANFDSTGESGELIFSQSSANLFPGDSITVNTIMNSLPQGNYQIISKVIFNEDENPSNNKMINGFTVFPPGNNFNDLVVNEIMYAPSSGEPEWIELYNRTGSPLNLKKWKVADLSTNVTITGEDKFIPANGFIVLTKDSSILNFYNVPSEIIKFNLPSLNNTGDAVVLTDSLGVLIDSVLYSPGWGGSSGGKSLERISVDAGSNDQDNWGTSNSPDKATPGRINSLTQKDFDIKAADILFTPPFPFKNDTVSISAEIMNVGLNSANFTIQLFEDTNLDSIPDVLLETTNSFNLSAGDSNVYQFDFQIQNIQSEKGFLINAVFAQDEDTTNNKLYGTIAPGVHSQSVVVNEIMYTPSGGEPEWIELYNNTNEQINLNGWSVTDLFTTPATATIDIDLILPPNSYAVLTKDISIINYHRVIPKILYELNLPVLNNDTDGIILKDNRGATIDSVHYFSDWGGTNGFSLERKDALAGSNLKLNWGSSVDFEQSTPGRINSITPKQFDLAIAGISFNPRFPVDGDDVFISAKIKNNGSANANNFSVEFFIDTDGNNIVDFLLSEESNLSLVSGDSLTVTSSSPVENLTSKTLTAVRIVFTEDEDTLNNYLEKTVQPGFPEKAVEINEVMYSPENGEPEWVELINVSGEMLNLINWSISDVLPSPTKNFITGFNLLLEPGEFLVVAKDTSFYSFHPEVTAQVAIVNFGSLGNTKDGVIVYDFRDGIIDSLFYRSSWGGKNGYSLERISVDAGTNDSTNWTSSLSVNKSTPGEPNSIGNAPSYERNTLAINEIMFDPDVDNSEFVEFYNLSGDSVNIGGWRIEDEKGNFFKLAETTFMLPPDEYFVLAADSAIIEKYSIGENNFLTIQDVSTLGLINTGELILLKDVKGNVIDSVWYSDKWHNDNFISTKNISLERINPNLKSNDPANWSSSVDPLGATPDRQNSIFTNNLNQQSSISVSPNPFSPDNDGFEDFTIINYNLTQAVSEVRIKIFDSRGRLVRTLLNNQPSGSSGSVIFDGRNDSGEALRIGIYIIFLEAINEGSGVVENMKTVVVVGRKL